MGAASASPGRIVCSRCGANNFQTQAACWKCGASLVAASPPPPLPGSAAGGAPLPPLQPVSSVDPNVAAFAAWTLAFLFPFVAVPVGLVFLMLDDRRKVQIGKTTLIAGTLFSLLHLWATWAAVRPVIDLVRPFLPGNRAAATQPGPNDSVPPLQLPGIPQTTPPSNPVPFPNP